MSAELGITIGYAIFWTTVIGSVIAVILMTASTIKQCIGLFKTTTKRKIIDQTATKSLPQHERCWICSYCQSVNSNIAFSCGFCKAPRRTRRELII